MCYEYYRFSIQALHRISMTFSTLSLMTLAVQFPWDDSWGHLAVLAPQYGEPIVPQHRRQIG